MESIKPHLNKFFQLLNGSTGRHLHDLKRWQWMTLKDSEILQKKLLKNLLEYAYLNIPYYRKVLRDSGVVSGDRKIIVEALSKVPLLTKDLIKKHYHDLKAPERLCKNSYEKATGGSTGEPARFIQDHRYGDWARALTLLQYSWSGYEPGQKRVLLWGSERDLFIGEEKFKTKIIRWMRGEVWLNAFRMTAEHMSYFVEIINSYKPISILAYAESIYALAVFIEQGKRKIYSPKVIMTSAGPLYPHMRAVIERVFKTSVFDRYGTRECGNIACECDRHEGLHVSMPTHYVEILKEDGSACLPGEQGEVVVTMLSNYAMPLIRYRIGDIGIQKENGCSCGRGWTLLETIVGRTSGVLIREDGGIVSTVYFRHLLGVVFNLPWLKRFQVIQEGYDYIRILIVLRGDATQKEVMLSMELKEIEEKIKLVVGNECRVVFEFVDEISPEISGKYSYVISKIRQDYFFQQNQI